MNPIIYVSGDIADAIGAIELKAIANRIATAARQPVDILTHGPSELHYAKRFTGTPEA